MPEVLVIDDEANIRELVSVYLTAAGMTVRQAADGASGLAEFDREPPDLVVLDIMLPGLDGSQVCRRIRGTSAVPIVMLTARDREIDKVALLEAGADDYVTKPFSPPELVARVRAVLRRYEAASPAGAVDERGTREDPIVVGGLRIDPASREVAVDGRPVELTAKEFDLLATMAADPGIVFSRERLLERVWGYGEFLEGRGVDVHIRHLREKLGDAAASPRFIETVRGAGYRVRREA
jgi:two-component system alkaline phosphatase synthesis response regulator PhoP